MMEYSFCYPDYSSKWSDLSSGKLHGSLVVKCLLGILKWKTTFLPKLCHFQHFLPKLAVVRCLCVNGRAGQGWAALPLTLKA